MADEIANMSLFGVVASFEHHWKKSSFFSSKIFIENSQTDSRQKVRTHELGSILKLVPIMRI